MLRRSALSRPALALAALLAAAPLDADVFILRNGDRITGTPYRRGTKFVRIETPYGKLRIPLAEIERIVREDGSEELLNAATPDGGRPGPAAAVPLLLEIEGNVFWYAWPEGKRGEIDPTLRLAVSVDRSDVAVFTDPLLNPGELEGAMVNSFSFREDETTAHTPEGYAVSSEVSPGTIRLRLTLPGELAGERLLRLAYQLNEGTAASPEFRDATAGGVVLRLEPGRPNRVRVAQFAGDMEYSGILGFIKRKMKNVDSFRIQLEPLTP